MLVNFLLTPTILAAPFNQADASPILSNTEADFYKPSRFVESRRFVTLLRWQDNWWDMPELAEDVASMPHLYGAVPHKKQHLSTSE